MGFTVGKERSSVQVKSPGLNGQTCRSCQYYNLQDVLTLHTGRFGRHNRFRGPIL